MSEHFPDIAYSLICPVHNHAAALDSFYRRLKTIADGLNESYEIIFVNDGSSDTSLQVMQDLARRDGAVRLVDLSRHFGRQAAVTAGCDFSSGKAVILLDADFQFPPELVQQLVEKWQHGAEVVYAVGRAQPENPSARQKTWSAVRKAIWRAAGVQAVSPDDYRLLDRRVVLALRQMRERERLMPSMVRWMGFRQQPVNYCPEKRHVSHRPKALIHSIQRGFLNLLGNSMLLIRLVAYAGLAMWLIAALLVVFLGPTSALLKSLHFPWLLLGALSFSGLHLLALAAVGYCVVRLHDDSRARPPYIVRLTKGFERDDSTQTVSPARPTQENASRFSVMT